jgi:RNA polymerase sigma factor (sigma-70 family)
MAATAVSLRYRRASRAKRPLAGDADERLVARVRAGDDAAFEAVFDRYHGVLLAFCRHMLASREEAEDVLQHVFVSAYRSLRAGGDDVQLRPWLYAIARNRCLSVLRSRRDAVDVSDLQAVGAELDGLASQVQRRSELRDLVDDMQRLPEDQRAALVLFELGDQSHEEIAQVLGVRKDKVKALVFQAREGLVRARDARETPCAAVREQLAVATVVSSRGALRRHLDRCPGCEAFAAEVRRQRSAFAAILPVAPTIGLKAAVLGSVLGGGGVATVGAGAGAGAGAGGAALVTGAGAGAGAGGGAAIVGATAGAGVTAGGFGGLSAGSIATGIAVVGAGASSVHGGLAGGGKAVVAKILTAVAVSGGGVAERSGAPPAHPTTRPAVEQVVPVPPAPPAPGSIAAPTSSLTPALTSEEPVSTSVPVAPEAVAEVAPVATTPAQDPASSTATQEPQAPSSTTTPSSSATAPAPLVEDPSATPTLAELTATEASVVTPPTTAPTTPPTTGPPAPTTSEPAPTPAPDPAPAADAPADPAAPAADPAPDASGGAVAPGDPNPVVG